MYVYFIYAPGGDLRTLAGTLPGAIESSYGNSLRVGDPTDSPQYYPTYAIDLDNEVAVDVFIDRLKSSLALEFGRLPADLKTWVKNLRRRLLAAVQDGDDVPTCIDWEEVSEETRAVLARIERRIQLSLHPDVWGKYRSFKGLAPWPGVARVTA